MDTVIGLVVAVSAWLIVDAVMVTLYHPDVPGWDAWSSLIKGEGKLCLKQAGSLPTDKLNEADITGITATGQTLDFSVNNVSGNACNPQTIVDAVPGVSIKTANLLACIAKGESDCGKTNKDNYNENEFWNKDLGGKYAGKASTAAGAYQVLLQSNSDCYNIPVCEEAVGTPGVALNCKKGFNPNGSGFTAGGDATILNKCVKAAGDVHCSAAAAVCVLSHQSFSSAYATDRYLPICQGKYGN